MSNPYSKTRDKFEQAYPGGVVDIRKDAGACSVIIEAIESMENPAADLVALKEACYKELESMGL